MVTNRAILLLIPIVIGSIILRTVQGASQEETRGHRALMISPRPAGDKTLADIDNDMIPVVGGIFMMDNYSHSQYGKHDQHKVTISSFFLSKYEITNRQWNMLMKNSDGRLNDCKDCPVDSVSFEEVIEYISKLNQAVHKHYRLPTVAEWEYAEKGGNKGGSFKYSGSDDLNEIAWYARNSDNKTHPVGQKKPNQLGLYDMIGNAMEWCSSWIDWDNPKANPETDPQGPLKGTMKALRGSYFGTNPEDMGMQYGDTLYVHRKGSGFRVARDSQ